VAVAEKAALEQFKAVTTAGVAAVISGSLQDWKIKIKANRRPIAAKFFLFMNIGGY
jgi:hypothetical protein